MNNYVYWGSNILFFFIGLFTFAQGTWIETLFRKCHLGFFIDACMKYNTIIISVVVMIFFAQWIKNKLILLVIGIALFVFMFLTKGHL